MFKTLLLLASIAFGQDGPGSTSVSDFSGGLNTRQSSIKIADNESPATENFLFDETSAAATKRKGVTRINASQLGQAADINNIFNFELQNGTKYCVTFSSTSGYYSSDACQSFTVYINTITKNNEVNCSPHGNRLYCVNNQYFYYFAVTDDIPVLSAPADPDYIVTHKNYCFVAGTDTNPSRLYYSAVGNCASWTTLTDYIDINDGDGDIITGLGPTQYDMLPIYKKYSKWVLEGDKPSTWKIVNVSKTIGARNHREIANFKNRQCYSSYGPNGGQPGVYCDNLTQFEEVSWKIRSEIESLSNFAARAGRRIYDSKSDFDTGTYDPYTLTTAREPGFLQSTYTARGDDSSADFSEGILVNISTTDVSGAITLTSDTFKDNFSDGNINVNPLWKGGALWQACDGGMGPTSSAHGAVYANSSVSTGSFSWSLKLNENTGQTIIRFLSSGVSATVSPGYGLFISDRNRSAGTATLEIYKYPAETRITSGTVSGWPGADSANFQVFRSSVGMMQIWFNGAFVGSGVDTDYNTSSTTIVSMAAGVAVCNSFVIDNFSYYGYKDSGTYTSRSFDTYISTPVFGPFTAVVSSGIPAGFTGINFKVQTATAAGGVYNALSANQTIDARNVATPLRYIRYQANLTTAYGTSTPVGYSVSMPAKSTGAWRSPEIYLDSRMTSWGTFQTSEITVGSGTIKYCIQRATFTGFAISTNCIDAVPGSAITGSTGAYVVVIASFSVGSSTDIARLDSFAINYNLGSGAKASSMVVFKGRLHYGGQSSTGTLNDVIYVMDSNGAWSKWTGLYPRSMAIVNQNLVLGISSETSTHGGYLYKMYDSDSDNGNTINAFWESKDFMGGALQNLKSVYRLYSMLDNTGSTMNITLKTDGGVYTSTKSVSANCSTDICVKATNFEPPINGNTFRFRLENNQANGPLEIRALGAQHKDIGPVQP